MLKFQWKEKAELLIILSLKGYGGVLNMRKFMPVPQGMA